MNADSAECKLLSETVPEYVEYVLTGKRITGPANVEDHVAGCAACGAIYSDLLGIKIVEETEFILDLTLGMNSKKDGGEIRTALGGQGTDPDLTLASGRHWLDVSRNGPASNERSYATALACIGVALEIKGDLGEALGYYRESNVLARRLDNAYAKARSASGIGRVMAMEGRKTEAIVHLRLACTDNLQLKDGVGAARDYLAIGDLFRDSKGISGQMESLRSYGQSLKIASKVGYGSGKAVAEVRLRDFQESVAVFFRDLVGDFVSNHFKKEAALLDEFCHAFFSSLADSFGSDLRPAPVPISSRLGFSAAPADIKTIALLSTIVTTFEEIAAQNFAGNANEAAEVRVTGSIHADHGAETRQAISCAISQNAVEHGLSKTDSGRLTVFLTQRINDSPELLEDLEFAKVDL